MRAHAETRRFSLKSLQRLAKAVIFTALFILLLSMVSDILAPKYLLHQDISPRGFYLEQKNSIDIIAVGNSNLYCGLSPLELWNSYGYAAFVAGESNETIVRAFNLLKEALTCQKPKLVILETDQLFGHGLKVDLESLFNHYIEKDFTGLLYNSNWKSLSADDFIKKPERFIKTRAKGFFMVAKTQGYTGGEYMVPTDK